jgi:stage III sporulation protein AH
MSNKKKIIIIVSMVILLVATVTANVLLNKAQSNPIDNPDDSKEVSYFNTYRTDREAARNQEFSYLDSIITSTSSTTEAKASAEAMKLELCTMMEKELTLENLIKAQGFEDAIITINTNNINVVVNDQELIASDVAQILTIITTETEFTADKVVVIPYN